MELTKNNKKAKLESVKVQVRMAPPMYGLIQNLEKILGHNDREVIEMLIVAGYDKVEQDLKSLAQKVGHLDKAA